MRALAELGWLVFVSIAPMREPVRLPQDFLALGDRAWVIVAGEQGAHLDCREMDLDWARAIRNRPLEVITLTIIWSCSCHLELSDDT
jgi:protein gp37